VTDVLIMFRTSDEMSLQYNDVQHYSICRARCWQGYYANYLKTYDRDIMQIILKLSFKRIYCPNL